MITGQYVNVNGVKTYYETNNGPADRARILCIHTSGRDSRQYHEMMDLLGEKYRVVALDMPGHGKSWPKPGNRVIDDAEEYCEFLYRFARAVGLEDYVILGGSWGGNVVFRFAQKYPVAAVVSLQGIDYIPPADPASLALLDHPQVSVQRSHMGYTDSITGRACRQDRRDFIRWGVKTEIAVTKKADLTMYNCQSDFRAGMDRITCPVLVFRGEDDWFVPEKDVESTVAHLVNAKRVVYEHPAGVGHFPAVECPELLCGILDRFLSED